MKRRIEAIAGAVAGIVTTGLAGRALAQASEAAPETSRLLHLMDGVIGTLVYGLIGILLVVVGYKVFSWILPFDVKKELEEDHNVAVGILLAALVLGICLVVAASIHS